MLPGDIVVDSKTPEGTRALRNYLEYASTGHLPIEVETERAPDSDFEVAVIEVLQAKGYECTPQLGVAGFRIDIGVRHPRARSGYLAAIECDGATYHTGVSVRDRDRIRQEVLEGLGWKGRIWRIWSADWFRNPVAEAERMFRFLETLAADPVPEGYLPEVEPPQEAGPEKPQDDSPAPVAQAVLADEATDLEIEVGDLVTYAPADDTSNPLTITITRSRNDLGHGLIWEGTPLAAALLGATVGETVVLRVPGRAPQSFVIMAIKRHSGHADEAEG